MQHVIIRNVIGIAKAWCVVGIMQNSRKQFHIFVRGTVTSQRNFREIVLDHVRIFKSVLDPEFLFIDDNAHIHVCWSSGHNRKWIYWTYDKDFLPFSSKCCRKMFGMLLTNVLLKKHISPSIQTTENRLERGIRQNPHGFLIRFVGIMNNRCNSVRRGSTTYWGNQYV